MTVIVRVFLGIVVVFVLAVFALGAFLAAHGEKRMKPPKWPGI